MSRIGPGLLLLAYIMAKCLAFVPLPHHREHSSSSRSSSSSLQASSYSVDVTKNAGSHDQDILISLLKASSRSICEPEEALARGTWFKLICGASYQDLPRIMTLALAYTLAGADCIDMSADEAVVTAVTEGVDAAVSIAAMVGYAIRRPWLMVSVNDQEDLHFRKASFDATKCPSDCPRPCETICPTSAIIASPSSLSSFVEGVAHQGRCYGCGRCLSICPLGLIEARPYQVDAAAVLSSLGGRIDALEIHTNASSLLRSDQGDDDFELLWERIRPMASRLRAVSVSFPFMGEEGTADFLRSRSQILLQAIDAEGEGEMSRQQRRPLNIWQTDGRPMSGDIGRGTTLSAVRFGEMVLRSDVLPFGDGQHYLQLAGGTNAYTSAKLEEVGLLSPSSAGVSGEGEEAVGKWVSGLAFGGYARKEVDQIMRNHGLRQEDDLLEHPETLADVVKTAFDVVQTIKSRGGGGSGGSIATPQESLKHQHAGKQ